MNHSQLNTEKSRKHHVYWLTGGTAFLLGVAKLFGLDQTPHSMNLWWTGLLLVGAMITGFMFQPMGKAFFPKGNDPKVKENPELQLKDHETMMGYYPLVALIALVVGYCISPFLFDRQILFEIKNAHFWWATIASGMLNVLIFYFLTKGLRYGDVSLISTTWGLSPIFTLPVSFLVFAIIGESAGASNPAVSFWGLIGIIITVAAIIGNGLMAKKKPSEGAPAGDWFAHHPMLSGVLAGLIAAFAVNFDKIAVDAGNPLLHTVMLTTVVFLITLGWTLVDGGWKRVCFVFKKYRKAFFVVGIVYAAIILIMNIALYGHNVNYYAAIKRTSVLFGTVYGIYVLHEGGSPDEKFVRIFTAVCVIISLFLIAFKG